LAFGKRNPTTFLEQKSILPLKSMIMKGLLRIIQTTKRAYIMLISSYSSMPELTVCVPYGLFVSAKNLAKEVNRRILQTKRTKAKPRLNGRTTKQSADFIPFDEVFLFRQKIESHCLLLLFIRFIIQTFLFYDCFSF